MKTIITIDPLTRISGFLEIEVKVDKNKIIDAKSSGMLFRGFEKMLKGRNPFDAIYFTERICGICSTAHALASTVALEDALNITSFEITNTVRDIIHGFEFIQNHIRHFYLFTIPDYVKLTEISSIYETFYNDFRIPNDLSKKIEQNYIDSIEYSRLAHVGLSILGGKAPHNHGIFVGGISCDINSSKLIKLKSLVQAIKEFVGNKMVEDANIISKYYKDNFYIGGGYKNFLTYGLYDSGIVNYVKSGVLINGEKSSFNVSKISENIYSSWYKQNNFMDNPSEIPIDEDLSKIGAYSFIKAPRYDSYPLEVGPLARMYISSKYDRGVSAMDRTLARVYETKLIIDIIEEKIIKLEELLKGEKINQPYSYEIPMKAFGKGLIDTTRGALAHFTNIENGNIMNYNIITPSGWNLSPQDSNGKHGVVEKALIGTTIDNIKNPVEIGRIVRSFDPCVSCATHVISNEYSPITIRIV